MRWGKGGVVERTNDELVQRSITRRPTVPTHQFTTNCIQKEGSAHRQGRRNAQVVVCSVGVGCLVEGMRGEVEGRYSSIGVCGQGACACGRACRQKAHARTTHATLWGQQGGTQHKAP